MSVNIHNFVPNMTEIEEHSSVNSGLFNYVVVVTSAFCVVLNVTVIFYIFHFGRRCRRIKRVNVVIANLSLCCIIAPFTAAMYLIDNETIFKGSFLCPSLSFARTFLTNLISLSVCGVSFERMRQLKFHRGKMPLPLFLLLIWSVSFLGAFPASFTTAYHPHPQECQKTWLFGYRMATVLFETSRCTGFHAAVSLYMAFEMYKVRIKTRTFIQQFKEKQSWRQYKKLQKIRFLYLTSITFILMWLPFGITMTVNRIVQDVHRDSPSYPILYYSMVSFMYLYIISLPFIILCTQEDLLSSPRVKLQMRNGDTDFSKCSTLNFTKSGSGERQRELERQHSYKRMKVLTIKELFGNLDKSGESVTIPNLNDLETQL